MKDILIGIISCFN